LDGRTVSLEGYRFGFQDQEKDDEIKGEGNSLNYTFRMHDSRLGRFFAVDPLTFRYPNYSSYIFSGNRIMDCLELEGLEPADAIKGAEVLVIVVLGYSHEPKKGETQYQNDSRKDVNDNDISVGSREVGLTSIESNFSSNEKTQIVVFSSAASEELTVKDIGITMHNFIETNPNGKIILVGHSMGADNIIVAAQNNEDVPIELLYSIDICDNFCAVDDDNIPSNVNFHINIIENGSNIGGEETEIMDPKKTIGFNHVAQEPNVSHKNVDNMYVKKVINRITRVTLGLKPLTDSEIKKIQNNN
jgi:hypothetical protein